MMMLKPLLHVSLWAGVGSREFDLVVGHCFGRRRTLVACCVALANTVWFATEYHFGQLFCHRK